MANTEMTTVIDVLLRCIEAEGVEHIFGIPGGPLTPLYEGLATRRTIRHILAKHEQGAAFMANAYARVRRGLGVCCATSGPGATNALTGIAASYADSIPVLLVTAQVATSTFGKGPAQDSSPFGVDVVQIFKPVTKLSAMVEDPERTQDLVQAALRAALSGRQGPVHLTIPANMAMRSAPYTPVAPSQYRPRPFTIDHQAIQQAARALLEAQRPCILAGHGVALSGAAQELVDLAARWRIPVATTPKGKGCFPEDHPMFLGVFGFPGQARAEAYMLSGQIDVLIVVGSSMGELATLTWDARLRPTKTLIQIDIDPREIGKNYPADIGINGDARTSLRAVNEQMAAESPDRPVFSEEPLRLLRELEAHVEAPPAVDADPHLVSPRQLIQELPELLPPETLFLVDIGNCMMWASQFFRVRRPYTYFLNLGLASMGHAIAGAVGAKLAAPNKPVVVLGGDAAFAMNGMEIHTAVECSAQITWIILNNGGHGMVHQGEVLLHGGDLSDTTFHTPMNICQLAISLGARGFCVTALPEFRQALREAMAHKGPCVIDVRIDPEEVPTALALRAKTLSKFFAGKLDASPTSLRIPRLQWSNKG